METMEEENSFEDFYNRFGELAAEAKKYGVMSCYALHEDNPIAEECSHNYGWSGGKILTIGLVEQLRHRLVSIETE